MVEQTTAASSVLEIEPRQLTELIAAFRLGKSVAVAPKAQASRRRAAA